MRLARIGPMRLLYRRGGFPYLPVRFSITCWPVYRKFTVGEADALTLEAPES